MRPLNLTKPEFVILWTLAGLWLPLLVAGWLYAIAMQVRPPSIFESPMEIRILKILANLGVVIACLSQTIFLIGRVHRPWLWIVAGVIAYLIQNAIVYVVFDIMTLLPKEHRSPVQIALPFVAIGIGLASAQAWAINYWRLGGLRWFAFSFGAFWLGFIALLIVDRVVLALMLEPSIARATVRDVLKVISLWATFGCITGWILWGRLLSSERQAVAAS